MVLLAITASASIQVVGVLLILVTLGVGSRRHT
jgi:hypothetical protein